MAGPRPTRSVAWSCALRKLRVLYPDLPYVFVSERGGPRCRRRRASLLRAPANSLNSRSLFIRITTRLWVQSRQRGPGHARDSAVPPALEHHAHSEAYGIESGAVQEFLEGLSVYGDERSLGIRLGRSRSATPPIVAIAHVMNESHSFSITSSALPCASVKWP